MMIEARRPLVVGLVLSTLAVADRASAAVVTARVSVSSGGTEGNNYSICRPAITPDGRYVVFVSEASRDWQGSITRRMSYTSAGSQANESSYGPALSPDGRYIAFSSSATNLVSGDSNAVPDVFVRDWASATTRRGSVSGTGLHGNNQSEFAAVGAGGRSVAFTSWATNLVPTDTNGFADIFVRIV